ncbi:MAG: hypothetical protein ACYC61_30090, partial [Isosphaeraceae bacterium]
LAGPRLAPLAALLAAAGAVAGLVLGSRSTGEGDASDRPAAGVAGFFVGVLVAAILHALVRTVEDPLGVWAGSAWILALLWGALGTIAAGLTIVLLPARDGTRKVSP